MSTPRRLTVVNVRNVYAYGGSDTAMLSWSGALDRGKFNPLVALFANADDAERQTLERAQAIGLPTFLIPGGRRKRLWTSVRSLVQLIREQRVDVLHLHDVKSDLVGLIAARITKRPAIGAAYAWFGDTSLFRARVYEWLDVRLLHRCECVLAISEAVRRQTIDRGLPADRVVTILSGIDYEAYQVSIDRAAVRRSLGADPDDYLIGNIARLFPEKDQATLLAALQRVLPAVPRARLLIVGDGPLEPNLRRKAGELGIAARVTFAGFRRDLPQVLQALDLQVHSSLKEGLPVAVCSGMAAGLPVISTDIDGVAEVITTGATGLLVPAGHADDMARAIATLALDPARARSLGDGARQVMHDRFRLEHVVTRLEAVYRDVHDRWQARRPERP